MDLAFKIGLLFVLILVNAFFAMSEIAIISLNDTKMQRLAEEGDKKAKQIIRLTENSSNFLSTIQIGVTLAGFLTSASASQNFADMLTNALAKTAVADVVPLGCTANPHRQNRENATSDIPYCGQPCFSSPI